MISSAALAIVVGVFIGWEERIVNSLIDDSASIQETVPDFVRPEMDESAASTRLFNLVFGGVTVFILIVSMLFTGLGVLGG
jgi:hypothetical protein